MSQYLLSAGLVILLAACSATGSSGGPPDIVYGRHICLECGMIITEESSATAYEWDGEDRIFDDVFDMLIYGHRTGELGAATRAWVHDHETTVWIDAIRAWFVSVEDTMAPMRRRILAFASSAAAEQFIAVGGGDLLTWDDLLRVSIESDGFVNDHTGSTP